MTMNMKNKNPDNPFAQLDKQLFPKDAEDRRKKEALAKAPPAPEPVQEKDEDELFAEAMSTVAPLAQDKGRQLHLTRPEPPRPELIDLTDRSAMLDVMSGKIEFCLEFTDEYMEGRVKGLDLAVMGKLKAGTLSPQAHLDLHGLNIQQARISLMEFIQGQYMAGRRCVLVITGRGLNSPEGYGVLRGKVRDWLTSDPFKRVVLAFCTAAAKDGGRGALYVLLRQYRKTQGKIYWEQYRNNFDG